MRHTEIFNSKILGEKWQSQSWETKSHHSCKLPSTVFTNAVFTVLTTNLILVKTMGFTIHVCLRLIHGQMRMNMTLTQYRHWHMLHGWYTTIFVPDVSQNETNRCLFPTYRSGTNFQTSCQCVTHRLTSQSILSFTAQYYHRRWGFAGLIIKRLWQSGC